MIVGSALAVIVAVIISLCFKGSTTCGCCGCVANGHYAEAKKVATLEETVETLRKEINDLKIAGMYVGNTCSSFMIKSSLGVLSMLKVLLRDL